LDRILYWLILLLLLINKNLKQTTDSWFLKEHLLQKIAYIASILILNESLHVVDAEYDIAIGAKSR